MQKIDIVANTVGNVANQQELLAKHLSDAAASLETGAADARAKAQAVKDGIAEAKGASAASRIPIMRLSSSRSATFPMPWPMSPVAAPIWPTTWARL